MDEIVPGPDGLSRSSGTLGGTEGGMSSGEVLRVRAAMKPISTIPRALRTIDTATGEEAAAHHQRSDVCAVPAAGVVAEAMVALVLADACLEKFGGDSMREMLRNWRAFEATTGPRNLRTGSLGWSTPRQPRARSSSAGWAKPVPGLSVASDPPQQHHKTGSHQRARGSDH